MDTAVFKLEIILVHMSESFQLLFFQQLQSFLNLATKASQILFLKGDFIIDINDPLTSIYNVTSIMSYHCSSQCVTKLSHLLLYSQLILSLFLSQTWMLYILVRFIDHQQSLKPFCFYKRSFNDLFLLKIFHTVCMASSK